MDGFETEDCREDAADDEQQQHDADTKIAN